MATKDLYYWLDHFCENTKRVVNGEDSFSTMVFVVTPGEICNNLIMGIDDDDSTAEEKLPRFYEFGREIASEQQSTEVVVVAQALAVDERHAIMVLHGCTNAGQGGHRGFNLLFEKKWSFLFFAKRILRVGEDVTIGELGDGESDYNPAVEVLRGILDGAKTRN